MKKFNQLVPGILPRRQHYSLVVQKRLKTQLKWRAYTKRAGVIAFTSGYHGRTIAALALTGKVAPYSKGMGLMSANVFRAEFPCEMHGVSDDDAMASIERIFKNDAEPSDIAAIILEPVQGEGGFMPHHLLLCSGCGHCVIVKALC